MMNPKSIAFVIHGLPMGGAEKFMISIVNHLFDIKYDPIVILLSHDDTLASEICCRHSNNQSVKKITL